MNFGGSFLGLIVFSIHLGGMLVVFGYMHLWLLNNILRCEFLIKLPGEHFSLV